MFSRQIKLPKNHSFFLFGPRGTGKSTLIKQWVNPESCLYIDLLLFQTENQYTKDPDLLYRKVGALSPDIQVIVIDEIQKCPKLLDIVHKLIEETGKKFILTGSSARKLKKGSANLLAGRAFERTLHPLTAEELKEAFQLDEVLQWGSLPGIYQFMAEEDKRDFLEAYANTYLKEEVWSEHLIRNLDPFRKFLEVAAQHNGKIINYSNIARDVGVDYKTIQSYFQILEDTLVGFILEPYIQSTRKRIYKAPKFYFFDLGVNRALANLLPLTPQPSTAYYGDLFEHFLILEFIRRESYLKKGYRFYYLADEWCEIDLIITRPGKPTALIEIKSTTQLRPDHVKSLRMLQNSIPGSELYCLSQDSNEQKMDAVLALSWRRGLEFI